MLRYIYTSPSAAATHNTHFLGHNEGLSLQRGLAGLLIITPRRKVSVLGLVTKSILKNMHLATAGRAGTRCLFRAGGRQTCGRYEKKKKNYISKQRISGRSRIRSQ